MKGGVREDDRERALNLVNDEFRSATLKDESIGIGRKLYEKSQKREI